ncbi:hypothetical protein JIR23_21895 [Bradyrhizobium diazoefficiens]|nr:hypothetical protein [Bradyrhizobium diazoefficiens]QQN62238.1 hypothetical protein JIR23_21895 [Bradyrhizobium diazoefficiens]
MITGDGRRVALVPGGSGIVGHSVAMELKRQGWSVRALARRPITGIETIAVDLTNLEAHLGANVRTPARESDPPHMGGRGCGSHITLSL